VHATQESAVEACTLRDPLNSATLPISEFSLQIWRMADG
jgi:hypothetical protein